MALKRRKQLPEPPIDKEEFFVEFRKKRKIYQDLDEQHMYHLAYP